MPNVSLLDVDMSMFDRGLIADLAFAVCMTGQSPGQSWRPWAGAQ